MEPTNSTKPDALVGRGGDGEVSSDGTVTGDDISAMAMFYDAIGDDVSATKPEPVLADVPSSGDVLPPIKRRSRPRKSNGGDEAVPSAGTITGDDVKAIAMFYDALIDDGLAKKLEPVLTDVPAKGDGLPPAKRRGRPRKIGRHFMTNYPFRTPLFINAIFTYCIFYLMHLGSTNQICRSLIYIHLT